jgi:hypothetical protein
LKACRLCHESKPLAEFGKNPRRKSGIQNECRECMRTYQREWKRVHADGNRDAKLRKKYGLTLKQYKAMLADQDDKCLICGEPFNPDVRWLMACVDHDHETGKVRGILHMNCNAALGLLGDSPEYCEAAAAYLRAA